MEALTLILFSLSLIACVATGVSILYALVVGYIVFCSYALYKKHTVSQIVKMSIEGIFKVKNILITFLLIGMLTALWRASGTIPSIVCYAVKFVNPSIFLLLAFLLNCLVSFLTGTAFGTAATMGAICMTMALALDMNVVVVGGAIVSGVYFGDRCSPVSTSALLISELTKTDIFKNIAAMFKTAAVPFAITCIIYTVIGFTTPNSAASLFDVKGLFAQDFHLGLVALIPAAIILLLSLFRIKVKTTMAASIAASVLVCLFYQQLDIREITQIMIFGYNSPIPQIAQMLDGGGIVSMLRVTAIVCLSSSYAGIFKATGLLDSLKNTISKLGEKYSSFGVIICTSIVSSMVACNQTLSIMLTHQLCDTVEKDSKRFAIALEDSVVVIAPLIPWSIAGAVPLASVSAPTISLLAACYLYLLPLWGLAVDIISKKRGRKNR